MPSLDSRIAALEQARPPADGVATIFIMPMSPGEIECDWNYAKPTDGARTWAREPGESVDAFKERIAAAAEPPKVQLVFLDTKPTAD